MFSVPTAVSGLDVVLECCGLKSISRDCLGTARPYGKQWIFQIPCWLSLVSWLRVVLIGSYKSDCGSWLRKLSRMSSFCAYVVRALEIIMLSVRSDFYPYRLKSQMMKGFSMRQLSIPILFVGQTKPRMNGSFRTQEVDFSRKQFLRTRKDHKANWSG